MQNFLNREERLQDSLDAPSDKLTAVIDIGSNSIRLVVFDGPSRVPMPKFNEKVLCGLGRDLGHSSLLGADAMESAMSALKRFTALVHHMRIDKVLVAATAAVREADNGPEFVADVEQECELNVQVLSGKQEARYAGLGVLSGMPYANGLVGDLGGGSLELVRVGDHKIGDTATLPLGALRLSQMGMSDQELKKFVSKKIKDVKWVDDEKNKNFYVVGGAWRAMARYHMAVKNHPLHIVHNYKLATWEVYELIEEILTKSDEEIAAVPLVPSSRVATMKTAARIMHQVLKAVDPKHVVFSSNGLREGMLFSEIRKNVRKQDPLIEACRDMAAKEGRFAEHGDEIYSWMKPCFTDIGEKGQRLARAAATLSDIAWTMSSDYRAGQAFRRIFRAPFSGIGHKGRAIVALSVYARYNGNLLGHPPKDALDLIGEEEKQHALSLGLALRLSHTLSGGTRGILPDTRLYMTDENIILQIPKELSVLLGVNVDKRLTALAESKGRKAIIKVTD